MAIALRQDPLISMICDFMIKWIINHLVHIQARWLSLVALDRISKRCDYGEILSRHSRIDPSAFELTSKHGSNKRSIQAALAHDGGSECHTAGITHAHTERQTPCGDLPSPDHKSALLPTKKQAVMISFAAPRDRDPLANMLATSGGEDGGPSRQTPCLDTSCMAK